MGRASAIRFPGHGGDEIGGILARPEGTSARAPGIVLVQEVFGLDPHIQSMTERLAAEGFVVLAPDLYSREGGAPGPRPTPEDPSPIWTMDEVRAAVASLPDRRVLGDLEGGLAHLASDPGVHARQLGAMGFCMGGNYAYMLGCTSRRTSAVIDFYGRFVYRELSPQKPIQPLELALNLSCPILAIFGEADPSIPAEDVERFRKTMDQFARDATIVTIPGVGHGFLNDRRKSYEREAAEKAWSLAVDFLREQLP